MGSKSQKQKSKKQKKRIKKQKENQKLLTPKEIEALLDRTPSETI
jgi:hypothetical protein